MFSCTPTIVMANWQRFDGKDHDVIKRSASLLLSKGIDIEEEGKIFNVCHIAKPSKLKFEVHNHTRT